jgi:protein TonB
MSVKTVFSAENAVGLLVVTVLHLGALYGLWVNNLLPDATQVSPLMVNFITPPEQPKVPQPARPPETVKFIPVERIEPPQLVAQAVVQSPIEYVAPPVPVQAPPTETSKVLAPSAQSGPATLNTELSVACPDRTPPVYPTQSRRLGESGVTLLRVELDGLGNVANAKVETSSGYSRLDDAALLAIRAWHCTPASRNGQRVRAIAMQPFKFLMQ